MFAFPLMRPLLMAGACEWGYFRKSFAQERAKVKVHFEGGGPVTLKEEVVSNNVSWEGLRHASCMFTRLSRSDP